MKNRFLLLASMFYMSVLFSCKMQSADDKLAIKISKSPSYDAVMKNTMKMAAQIKIYKADTVLSRKFKNLDSLQKRDSILKYLFRTDSFSTYSIGMADAMRKTTQEFPEVSKLTTESRKYVFKKATVLWAKANNVK